MGAAARSVRQERAAIAALLRDGATDVLAIADLLDLDPKRVFHAIQSVAYRQYNIALASGELVRPTTCADCGSGGRIHGHHHDYLKPLDVEWLCPACHKSRHRGPRMKWPTRPAPPFECLIRPEEAAVVLGVTAREVRDLARAGRLPHRRLFSRTLRFKRSELEAWRSAQQEAA